MSRVHVVTSAVIVLVLRAQQTRNICITFVQCWVNVEDVGPTLFKCNTNILFFSGLIPEAYFCVCHRLTSPWHVGYGHYPQRLFCTDWYITL